MITNLFHLMVAITLVAAVGLYLSMLSHQSRGRKSVFASDSENSANGFYRALNFSQNKFGKVNEHAPLPVALVGIPNAAANINAKQQPPPSHSDKEADHGEVQNKTMNNNNHQLPNLNHDHNNNHTHASSKNSSLLP